MTQPKTRKTAMGILGERSVMRTLILNHFYMELQPAGCTYYFIEHVEDEDTQKKEIDIIETWDDADGKRWQRAHEVKCEEPTLGWEYGKRPNKDLQNYAGKKLFGSGNVFVETIQKISPKEYFRILGDRIIDIVPEIDRSKYSEKEFSLGYYHVIRENEQEIEDSYNAGRWIWFVAYVPKSDVELYNAQVKSDDMTRCLVRTAQGVRWKELGDGEKPSQFEMGNHGFVLHSMPYESFARMMGKVEREIQIYPNAHIDANKLRGIMGKSKTSAGYNVSLEKYVFGKYAYAADEEVDWPIEGIEDTERGGKIYRDLMTWAKEKKMPEEYKTWEEDDWKTGHFEYWTEMNIEETDDDRLFIGYTPHTFYIPKSGSRNLL